MSNQFTIIVLLFFFSVSSSAQDLSERNADNALRDSILTYEVVADSSIIDTKYIRLRLFKHAKFINGQDLICYNYCNSDLNCDTIVRDHIEEDGGRRLSCDEMTGRIIQNDSVWMHPPRGDYFRVLELNAFPFLVYNKLEWDYDLSFGDHWADERWLLWTGRKMNNSHYRLTDENAKFKFRGEDILCKRIEAVSHLEDLGETESIFLYNEDYGFVYMYFKLINNQIVELRLI